MAGVTIDRDVLLDVLRGLIEQDVRVLPAAYTALRQAIYFGGNALDLGGEVLCAPAGSAVIYYLRDGEVVGLSLLSLPGTGCVAGWADWERALVRVIERYS